MRIHTDGKLAYREDLVDDAAQQPGEHTRVGAVEASCEFTRAMLPALHEAVEHEDMTAEFAEMLSTRVVAVEYEISDWRVRPRMIDRLGHRDHRADRFSLARLSMVCKPANPRSMGSERG